MPEAQSQSRQDTRAAYVLSNTCVECGMALDNAGEFHPYVFCVLKKAGRDPWTDFRDVLKLYYGDAVLEELPERPPRVVDTPRNHVWRHGGS